MIPMKSGAGEVHVVYTAVHGMGVLLTWNQKHIETDIERRLIEVDFRFRLPIKNNVKRAFEQKLIPIPMGGF